MSQVEPECLGVYFRAGSSQYVSGSKGITVGNRTTLTLLKRKSCPGCNKCLYLYDCEAEDFTIPKNLVNGAIYKARFQVLSTDWETGYVEDFTIVFDQVP